MEVADANDYLIDKKWSFLGADGNIASPTVKWAFDKKGDLAKAWLEQYQYGPDHYVIIYQFADRGIYTVLKNATNGYKMQLISQKVENNEIISKYRGKNYTITLSQTNYGNYKCVLSTNLADNHFSNPIKIRINMDTDSAAAVIDSNYVEYK